MSITGVPLLLVAGGGGGGVLDVLSVGRVGVGGHAGLALRDLFLLGLVGRGVAVRALAGADAGEVDAKLLRRAEEVVVLVANLGARALVGDDVDVERQRLHLLEQDLEGLGDGRRGGGFGLDDRLVGLHATDRVVGLDREHLLQRVGGAVGLQ